MSALTGVSFTAAQAVYLLLAFGLNAAADALLVRFLGGRPWRTAAALGFLALTPFAAVFGVFLLFLRTPFYESQHDWPMTFGLPLALFLVLVVAAWITKTLLLCRRGSTAAGLIAGLIVFPLLWTAILSGQGFLWNALDALRAP